jgi:aldehyde dehydrogenase (NAD+)
MAASASKKLVFTAVGEIAPLVTAARTTFQSGKTLSAKWRKSQLTGILKLVTENEEAIVEALKTDLRRPK